METEVFMQLSRSDMRCPCGCGFDTIDFELMDIYNLISSKWKEKIIVHSGCRCNVHNLEIGGSTNSMHTMGRAMDFHIENVINSEVYDFLDNKYDKAYGIGIYKWGVHVDSRGYKARWTRL